MTEKYGELIDDSTVRFERLLPGPIERIWQYLVDSDKRAKWLCRGDTVLEVGGRVDMQFHNASLSPAPDIEPPEKYRDMPEKLNFSGTVMRCEPPHLLEHTWDFENDQSEICYELEQVGNMVRLVLTHRRLASKDEITSVCGGWHTHLAILEAVLEGSEPPAFWKTHTPIEAAYLERLGF